MSTSTVNGLYFSPQKGYKNPGWALWIRNRKNIWPILLKLIEHGWEIGIRPDKKRGWYMLWTTKKDVAEFTAVGLGIQYEIAER